MAWRVMAQLPAVLLALTVAIGMVGAFSAAVPRLVGMRTMVVTSGSMEPAIGTGAAAIVKPLSVGAPIAIGDVVTFGTRDSGMVTHRVIASREIDGALYFQTKGDANETPDPNLTERRAVYGKVVFALPKLGYLLDFLGTVTGKLLFIGLPLMAVLTFEVKSLLRHKEQAGNPGQTR